jgi:hypothetical protein
MVTPPVDSTGELSVEEQQHPLLYRLLPKLRPFQREAMEFAVTGKRHARQMTLEATITTNTSTTEHDNNTTTPQENYNPQGRILLADEMGLVRTLLYIYCLKAVMSCHVMPCQRSRGGGCRTIPRLFLVLDRTPCSILLTNATTTILSLGHTSHYLTGQDDHIFGNHELLRKRMVAIVDFMSCQFAIFLAGRNRKIPPPNTFSIHLCSARLSRCEMAPTTTETKSTPGSIQQPSQH